MRLSPPSGPHTHFEYPGPITSSLTSPSYDSPAVAKASGSSAHPIQATWRSRAESSGSPAEHPFDVERMGPSVAQPVGGDPAPLDRPVEPGDLLVTLHAGEGLHDPCPRLAPPLDHVLGTHGIRSGGTLGEHRVGTFGDGAVEHLASAVE